MALFFWPEDYSLIMPKKSFMISVPSSAYGYERGRKVSKNIPLQSLMTFSVNVLSYLVSYEFLFIF